MCRWHSTHAHHGDWVRGPDDARDHSYCLLSLALFCEHRVDPQSLRPSLRFHRPCLRTKDPVVTVGSSTVLPQTPEDGKIHRLHGIHRFKRLEAEPYTRAPHLKIG